MFKTLFSKKEIEFSDMCETKSVSSALYLDTNEGLPDGEHNYHYIGKVGSFCPIKQGCGGGVLLRETENKVTGEKGYASATGCKDYRWLEAETVKQLGKENDIDRSYYDNLVTNAVADISKYGDFELFVSDESVPAVKGVWPLDEFKSDEAMPCGRVECTGCPNFTNDKNKVNCKLGYDIFPF